MNEKLTILQGDCRETLRTLPDAFVQCCVTSPPYFGLRDYGHEGQCGNEDTPDAFVQNLIEVFREVRRALRDDGTLWLNLGDSYAGGGGFCATAPSTAHTKSGKYGTNGAKMKSVGKVEGLKSKDLIGIPWRVAFALQEDGWYLRQEIIWNKPNCMPESVTDRCTKSHEHIFLLSKSERYYFDNESIKEKSVTNDSRRPYGRGQVDSRGNGHARGGGEEREGDGVGETRNKRSVWTVPTKPYKGAHFAVFPSELIVPCILAGCPRGGTVLDPFGGSGTTASTALKLQRRAILCELNPDYISLIHQRCDPVLNPVWPDLFKLLEEEEW